MSLAGDSYSLLGSSFLISFFGASSSELELLLEDELELLESLRRRFFFLTFSDDDEESESLDEESDDDDDKNLEKQ